VFHTFVGEKMIKDSVKKMVKKIAENYHLPYFTISPTFSICPIHGYLAGEHEYCPKCDAEQERLPLEVESAKKELEEEVVVERSVDSSVDIEDESIKIVEPKVERKVLVPMRFKLNLGGNEALGFEATGNRQQAAGKLSGLSALGYEKSKINLGGDGDGED